MADGMHRTRLAALGLLLLAACVPDKQAGTLGDADARLDPIGPDPGPGEAALTLSWTDHSDNEDGFVIDRRLESGGEFAELARTGVNAAGYVDAAVEAGVFYCYRVAAFNSAGRSVSTAEACGAAAAGSAARVRIGGR